MYLISIYFDGNANKILNRHISRIAGQTGNMFMVDHNAAPVLNEYLLNLSDLVDEKFKDIPETTISQLYRKGSWLPHVTLGKTLSKEQMATAFVRFI